MELKLGKIILILGILFIMLFSGCTTLNKNNTKQMDSLILRLADNHVKDYPTVKADELFADLVYERTNGEIKIDVYSQGQLGDEESVIDQVKFGVIDLARISIAPLIDIDKNMGVLALPYLYRDKTHMFRVLDGSLGDKFRNSLLSNQIYGLAWYDAGARNFYNSVREIKSPEDLQGLKIRVQEMESMKDYIKNLGAISVPMVFSEVFGAIQTGVIHGAENNWSSYVSTSHNSVAKYITIGEHIRIPELIIINKITYNNLTKEQQEIIEDCAKEAAIYQREEMEKEEQKAREVAMKYGSIITKLSNKEKELFKEKAMPLYESFQEQKDIIDEILNIR